MPPCRASPPRRPTSTAQPHRTQPADQCPPATISSVPPATSPQAPATTAPATTAPATTAPATRPRPPGSGHQAACHQHTPPTPPGHGHRHTNTHAHTHTHPGATRRRDDSQPDAEVAGETPCPCPCPYPCPYPCPCEPRARSHLPPFHETAEWCFRTVTPGAVVEWVAGLPLLIESYKWGGLRS